MADIANERVIYAKGILFLLGGLMASVLLLIEHPEFKVAFLLVVAIWCFARLYYFTFYVIGQYVDSSYKFSGLWSFAIYACNRLRHKGEQRSHRKF